MKFQADEITSVLRQEIAQFRGAMDVAQVGRVMEVGDGIAQVFGLSGAMAGEMLEFPGGTMGQVFNLEESSVGAVLYGDFDHIKEGDEVRTTGRLLEVPVGEEMLGRVVDPLGVPVDGGAPLAARHTRPVTWPAPGIAARQPVNEPLVTGIKAVDAMTPIGRGQRELIIGDRKTGKTAIAIDAIISQKDSGVLCVYVAIGQKESTVAGVVETLRANGAMAHTIVISASGSDPAPLLYIAPYSGAAIAEHFMAMGKATLVVYDDLSKQAAAYRQISLLLRRPPGREAYPGDVFYLHSRLLERACKLAERYVITRQEGSPAAVNGKEYVGPPGLAEAKKDIEAMADRQSFRVHRLPESGGSMTALPICETQEGEVSSYIPTNLISITDGQIYLEPSLFFAGVRPAINAGISVSRVGYKAAWPAMKEVAKSLRLDLAAFRELEAFSQLGVELDAATQRQLDRGQRMVRLLTQGLCKPYPVPEQVVSLFAGGGGFLDDLSVEEVIPFEMGLLEYVHANHGEFMKTLEAGKALPPELSEQLGRIVKKYKDEVFAPKRKTAKSETR
jgi:F-type H+/Na+-transporting ATPase subunit alpha